MKQLNDYILERGLFTKSNYKEISKRAYKYHPKTRNELQKLVQNLIKERGNDADLNDIDTSNITVMGWVFNGSKFNGDISMWDVSNVKDMNRMFYYSKFNGDISNWDVSNVKDMSSMFLNSEFNGDISDWDVSNVEDMTWIFRDSNFDQDISNWQINSNCRAKNMFDHCPIKDKYKPKLPQ